MLLDWRPFWIGLDRSNWISLFAPELNLARQSLDQRRKCPSSGLDWIESPIQLQSNPITSLGLIYTSPSYTPHATQPSPHLTHGGQSEKSLDTLIVHSRTALKSKELMTKFNYINTVMHHSQLELKAAASVEGLYSLTVRQLFGNQNNKQWSPQALVTQNTSQHMRRHYWHFLFRIYFKKLSHPFPSRFPHPFFMR